jgi:hypothetical protein
MTDDERPDPLFELLADLPSEAPRGALQHRVRARCHAALARHRIGTTRQRRGWALFDAAAFGAMGLYLGAVIATALSAAKVM